MDHYKPARTILQSLSAELWREGVRNGIVIGYMRGIFLGSLYIHVSWKSNIAELFVEEAKIKLVIDKDHMPCEVRRYPLEDPDSIDNLIADINRLEAAVV